MSALQIVAAAICFPLMLVGWALLFRQISRFVALYKVGQPTTPPRTNEPMSRTWTLLKEFLGHTRMSRLPIVAIAHWFTALSFLLLFGTLVNAFGQLIDPEWVLPVIGHFPPYEWLIEFFAWTGLIGILVLIAIRQIKHPRSSDGDHGRRSRFFGSTWWQAYYVEFTILGVTICILLLRLLEAQLIKHEDPSQSMGLHFPLTGWLSGIFSGVSVDGLKTLIVVVATIKIIISFAWMITISLTPTMGVAWHRFLAFPNIWFKREASGRTALGNLTPMRMGNGEPFSMEAMEALEEADDDVEPVLGVGKVEDFTWKGLLDFSTCTECGRCQSQCPAWNTDKPLSPKMLMMTLRDNANAKSPWLTASEEARAELPAATTALAELPLIGQTGYDIDTPLTAYNPHGPDAVIDEDVLWSCTTCGACVEQCPVDIEHVDHIVDMRRYQTLIESAFPSELGGLFKNLESKGNPWGMGARARLDWAKDLPFEVKILGKDLESADEVDYLFWVGCAGAYEDRAKKTTRAVAELLDTAGVSFAVLGDGETCTGDSARRAGNEILFSMLAQQNIETMGELGVQKIVVTCAHCFNTIKNEYPDLGGKFEVVHHTQLLNRLVRDKKLVPVARPADAPGKSSARDAASTASTVTYHDPCYLGRHNNVYAPPRELIGALPGVELREMERTKEKSFCCGAGGARMWMEEKLGSRINMNRTEEALATGAERIAIGCPFCRVMISDGLTAKQSEGVGEDVEVVDVAQMLLAAVRRGQEGAEESAPVDESAAAAVASESASYAGESGSSAGAAAAGAGVAGAAAAAEAVTDEKPAADAAQAAHGDPWDEPAAPAAAAPAAAAPAADADPWDTPAAPAAEAPDSQAPAADADPWGEPAAPAAAAPAADADPWDTPAAPAAEAPASEAPAADADPWDEPAAPAAAAPAPAESADLDPWDEPSTPTAQGSVFASPDDAKSPLPSEGEAKGDFASPGDAKSDGADVDPWDEPAAPAAAASPADTDVDPWDEPAAPSTTTSQAPAADSDVDPWDEPAPPAADASSTEAPAAVDSATEAPAASAPADDVLNAPDPWDEPAAPTPAAATTATESAPEPTVATSETTAAEVETETVAEPEQQQDATGGEATAPAAAPAAAAPANADDLLNAPDPWDEPADTAAPAAAPTATSTDTVAVEESTTEAESSSDEAASAPIVESNEVKTTGVGSVEGETTTDAAVESAEASASQADSEVEVTIGAADEPAEESEPEPEAETKDAKPSSASTSTPPANAEELLNAPDPWD